MTTRIQLHQLIDELSESDFATVERLLTALRDTGADPMLRALDEAREDDEPTTPEEDASAEEAWQEYRQGEGISGEEAQRLLL